MPTLSVASVVTGSGGILTVITYGGTVVGYISSAGTAVYVYGKDVVYFTFNMYMRNKLAIDALGQGIIDGLTTSPPNPSTILYYWVGWGITTQLKRMIGP